jgi:signal transduction histidine kinase/DNA-binding response OmpR family regulator
MSKPHILLVDDENNIALDIAGRLKSFGYGVCTVASSLEQALQYVASHQPDLVLMDIWLNGEMLGIDAALRIRAEFDIPVIFLTVYGDEDELHRAGVTAPFEYLFKSFNERELHATIQMALYKHRMELDIRQRDRELLAFQAASVAITSSTDLQSKLNAVTRELALLLRVKGCAIADWNQASNVVTLIAEYGLEGWWSDHMSPSKTYHLDENPHVRNVLVEWRRQYMNVHQSDIDAATLAYLQRAGIGALLMLPMIYQDRVIGLVEITDDRSDHKFSDQEILLAQLLANQAASVVQNARLIEAERAQRALAEALRDAATTLNSTPNFDEVLDGILEMVARVIPHHAANVMLVKSGRAYIVRSRGSAEGELEPLWLALNVPIDDLPYLAHMYESGQPVVIPHTEASSMWINLTETRSVRSYVGAPIRPKGRVLGFINLESATPDFFTPADAERLQIFTDQASVAVENAQLYDRIHRHADELEQRVTERTRELAEANKQLKELDRMKDEFLANMSHELRTPLNAILGLSEAMQEQVHGSVNDKQMRALLSIEESGRHLLSLITDILDLCKIGVGKLTLEFGVVSVEAVCQASLRMIKQAAHSKRLQVSYTVDSTVTTLLADERRLKQILVNLLSNAVKFTPEGGSIGLDVGGEAEKQVMHFTVWDTGLGIAREDMPRLFQPFVQLDSSLSRQHPGTGLGLALVYRMTEMHGGAVAVQSEVGSGSRFTISLPWSVPIEPPGLNSGRSDGGRVEEVVVEPRSGGRQPLILLAEDNEANIGPLVDYLPAKGYRVIVAHDGSEALARAREEQPDVILMDVQMPVMDGLEATRRIRKDAKLAHIPIIALTALVMHGDRERCLAAGVDEYLSKPVGLQTLVKTIEAQRERLQIEVSS